MPLTTPLSLESLENRALLYAQNMQSEAVITAEQTDPFSLAYKEGLNLQEQWSATDPCVVTETEQTDAPPLEHDGLSLGWKIGIAAAGTAIGGAVVSAGIGMCLFPKVARCLFQAIGTAVATPVALGCDIHPCAGCVASACVPVSLCVVGPLAFATCLESLGNREAQPLVIQV